MFCRKSSVSYNKAQDVQLFRYWKSKRISGYCMYTFIYESCPVVFKHFRVSLAVCVINIYLEHSFYIDINKNIISCFNTVKMFFVILLPISCKKMKRPYFSYKFLKRIENKQWLGVGLIRCDRKTVVSSGVNLSRFTLKQQG